MWHFQNIIKADTGQWIVPDQNLTKDLRTQSHFLLEEFAFRMWNVGAHRVTRRAGNKINHLMARSSFVPLRTRRVLRIFQGIHWGAGSRGLLSAHPLIDFSNLPPTHAPEHPRFRLGGNKSWRTIHRSIPVAKRVIRLFSKIFRNDYFYACSLFTRRNVSRNTGAYIFDTLETERISLVLTAS